ncbi:MULTISPECIES: hypothetical protein [unclassified Rubrivivax]|uniref:hypothetical protein n=1 Tax=unclassified Rubrivivax TaxID=2649762 RepID=UPI001E6518ED|nr:MULTISPECIES: hypothetical protein [unclassified Rubrivivax]MCC9598384.1 hypothetical protein [Rubrivivax sp. JA1055]MCC9648084.1 hypothetical protein [Rubrivivax sp. JA1029]
MTLPNLLCGALLAALGGAVAAAPDDPPGEVPAAAAADEAALRTLLPPGARLLHGPLALPFGADERGWLLALRSAGPDGGVAVWYLMPRPGDAAHWRLLRLRDPDPADAFFDIELRAAFAAGPEGAHDLVLLERHTRAAPAGGERHDSARVLRRDGDGVRPVPALEALLDGVTDVAEARRRLAPAYARLLPPVEGELAAAFVSLPLDLVDLTRLERLQRLQPGHPLHEVHDRANGYLALRGDGGRPAYVAALFRAADGGAVVAVQQRWPQAQRTRWLRRDGARWRDVTATLLPGWRESDDCTLPRQGRSIACADGRRWTWDGRSFRPEPP